EGVPVLPDALPGDAVSPGTSSCSLLNAPALTVIDGDVFAVLLPSVASVAGKGFEPAGFGVTEKVFGPAGRAAVAGGAKLASLELIATVSVEETGFQFASTALTVTLNDVPAV